MKTRPTNWDTLPLALTVKEAAAVLGMSESSLYRALNEPGFPVHYARRNGRIRIGRDALRAWLSNPDAQPTKEAA